MKIYTRKTYKYKCDQVKQKAEKVKHWHLWFARKPVLVGWTGKRLKYVWLGYVLRRGVHIWYLKEYRDVDRFYWEYREKGDKNV
jgi:hypothetical protein